MLNLIRLLRVRPWQVHMWISILLGSLNGRIPTESVSPALAVLPTAGEEVVSIRFVPVNGCEPCFIVPVTKELRVLTLILNHLLQAVGVVDEYSKTYSECYVQ